MPFDWYQATVPGASAEALVGGLQALEPGVTPVEGRGRYGYDVCTAMVLPGGEKLAEVWYGGRNGHPHVVSTSDAARVVAPWLRETWPNHLVTRVDACADFERPGVFADLADKCLWLADDTGIKVSHVGDWHRAQDGRTLMLGGRGSPVRARLYEKGIELRSRVPDLYQGIMRQQFSDDLVRLEVQVRPQTPEARVIAATRTASECWGFAAWSRALWERAAGEEVRRELVDKGYRPDDRERAYGWMLAGYGRILRGMRDDLGDWSCVGLQIGADLEIMAKVRAAAQQRKELMS